MGPTDSITRHRTSGVSGSAAHDRYERELLQRVARWPHDRKLSELSAEALREWTQAEGIDFATALLHERVRRCDQHRAFIEAIDTRPAAITPPRGNVALAIVPGAFYVEFPHTGADGRLAVDAAEQCGWPCNLIRVASFGPLRLNVQIIIDWLLQQSAARKVVLVSLCKGSGEVKLALGHPRAAEAFRHVVAWVNLSGLLYGTPLVEWLLSRPSRAAWYRALLWWRGYDFNVVRELGRRPGAPLVAEPLGIHGIARGLPAHLRVISVVGFPLRRHLTSGLARRCFQRLAHLGPNDGAGILLADACRVPGVIYPLWGADHYLKPAAEQIPLVSRLLGYLAEQLAPILPAPVS